MEEERGKARKTEIHTHILLNLQDSDEEQFLGLVLVEELWIKKTSLPTWTNRLCLVSKYKDHKIHKKFKSVPYATNMLSRQTKMS